MSAATVAPPPAASNGAAATPDPFPVESFKDAARYLRRPFTRAAVKFKVQATFPKDSPTGGLIVAYIDARLAVERLNLVCPHLWFDEYQPIDGGRLLCRLTVDGITRHDIGEGYNGGKGLYSDAFKRAAVKFGVGVSLYATPQTILNLSDGHLKRIQTQKGPSLALTPQGEARCRELYGVWLDTVGIKAFGDPLDHGDVEDAQGDIEAGEPILEPADEPPAVVAAEPLISMAVAGQLFAEADRIGVTDKLQLAASHAHGADIGPCDDEATAVEALGKLTVPQAEKVTAWLLKKAEEGKDA